MSASKWGQGLASRLLYQSQTTSTTPVVAVIPNLEDFDVASFVLVTENNTRAVAVSVSDSVVAGTGVWHFTGGAFTANDVGGTITVAGATNPGNNGTFTILSSSDATHVTTATAGLVNETFSASVTLTVTGAALTGSWKFEVSNDYAAANWGGQNATAGYWIDITSSFYPTIVSVTAPYPAASGGQYAQLAPIGSRDVRVTFTPATKAGLVSVYGFAKSSN